MNERLIKERRRDSWLIGASVLIIIIGLLAATLLLLQPQPLPVTMPESSPTSSATETIAADALPTSIRRESRPTPVILSLTPQTNDVAMTGVVVGQIAPDFTLPTLDGEVLTLSDRRGKPVVINFWASWCVPCRVEMPALVRAYEQYRADGLEIVAFNVIFQDSLSEVRAFVDEFQLPFPVVLDEAGHVTADDYQVRGLPMSIFINRDGTIARVQLGAMNEAQIEEFIGALLAEESPPAR